MTVATVMLVNIDATAVVTADCGDRVGSGDASVLATIASSGRRRERWRATVSAASAAEVNEPR